MDRALKLLGVFLVLALLLGCDRGEVDEEPIDYDALGVDPLLPPELEAQLAAQPTTSYTLDEIVLPNGRTVAEVLAECGLGSGPGGQHSARMHQALSAVGPQTQKAILLARMLATAHWLTDRSEHQHLQEDDVNGVPSPAQNGLAYVWGGKDKNVYERKVAKKYCTTMALYGLDCSGFITMVAGGAGVDVKDNGADQNANTLKDPVVWTTAFARMGLTKIYAKDVGKLHPSELESGDIVFWYMKPESPSTATHTGMILSPGDSTLVLFQSEGGDTCEINTRSDRGPRQSLLPANTFFTGAWARYTVIRIATDISGRWRLAGRCEDRDFPAFTLDLHLTQEDEQVVAASGRGTDYDGKPLEVSMEGTYSAVNNQLGGQLEFTFPTVGGRRVDEFSVRLNEDDTGYFPAELIYHTDTGCDLEIRLMNTETADVPTARHPGGGSGYLMDLEAPAGAHGQSR